MAAKIADLSPVFLNGLPGAEAEFPSAMRAELRSLRRERDSALLFRGLLRLGRELEERKSREAAGRIYRALQGGGRVPREVAAEARRRMEVLGGGGNFGEKVEYFLGRLVEEGTSPEMLVGMGGASVGFRLGRLAGMKGCFELGLTGGAWRLMSGISGWVGEASGFVLGRRSAAGALGKGFSWEGIGEEWGSAAILMGMLRATGWGSLEFYRGVQGEAAKRMLGGISEGIYRQVGIYLGIVGSHYLEQGLGRKKAMLPSEVLVESLGTLVSFNVAGQVAQRTSGRALAPLERSLDRKAKRFGPDSEEKSKIPAAAVRSQMEGVPGSFAGPFSESVVLMSGFGEGGSKRFPLAHLKDGQRFAADDPNMSRSLQSGEVQNVWPIDSARQLRSLLKDSRSDISQSFLMAHQTFRISPENHVNPMEVIQILNEWELLPKIPRGRLVRLDHGEGSPESQVEIWKFGGRFVLRVVKTPIPSSAPPANEAETSIPKDSGGDFSRRQWVSAEMLRVAKQMDNLSSSAPPPTQAAPKENSTNLERLPQIFSNPEEVPSRFQKVLEDSGSEIPPLVFRGPHASQYELARRTRGMGFLLPHGSRVEVWAPYPQKVFSGFAEGRDLRWVEKEGGFPTESLRPLGLGYYFAGNPLELYLTLESMARDPGRVDRSLTTVRYGQEFIPKLVREFTLEQLNQLKIRGGKVFLKAKGKDAPAVFRGEKGRWELERVSKSPPQRGSSHPSEAREEPQADFPFNSSPLPREEPDRGDRTEANLVERVRFTPTTVMKPNSQHVLQLARSWEEMKTRIPQILNPDLFLSKVEILASYGRPFEREDLAPLNHHLGRIPQGREFLVHDLRSQITFRFFESNGRLKADSQRWEQRVPRFDPFQVRDVQDLLQQLTFLRDWNPQGNKPFRVFVSGIWEPEAHGTLFRESLTTQIPLNFDEFQIFYNHKVRGQILRQGQQVFFRNPGGSWRLR